MDDEITTGLRRLIDATAVQVTPAAVTRARMRAKRRKGRTLSFVIVAVVCASIIGSVAGLRAGSDPTEVHVAGPPADLNHTTQWQMIDAPPLAERSGAAVASSDRLLFIWGGHQEGTGTVFDDGAVLDVETGRWVHIAGPPGRAGRDHASALWDGSAFLVVGGFAPGSDHAADSEVLSFEPSARAWSVVTSDERAAVTGAVIAWHDGELTVVGGYPGRSTTPSSATSRFDMRTGRWSDADPAPWPVVSQEGRKTPAGRTGTARGSDVITADVVRTGGEPALRLARLDNGRWTIRPVTALSPTASQTVPRALAISNDGHALVVLDSFEEVLVEVASLDDLNPAASNDEFGSCGEGDGPWIVGLETGWKWYDCSGLWSVDAKLRRIRLPDPPIPFASSTLIAVGRTLVALDLGSPKVNPNAKPRPPAAAVRAG